MPGRQRASACASVGNWLPLPGVIRVDLFAHDLPTGTGGGAAACAACLGAELGVAGAQLAGSVIFACPQMGHFYGRCFSYRGIFNALEGSSFDPRQCAMLHIFKAHHKHPTLQVLDNADPLTEATGRYSRPAFLHPRAGPAES